MLMLEYSERQHHEQDWPVRGTKESVQAHRSVLVVVESFRGEHKPAVQPVSPDVTLLLQVAHLEHLPHLVGTQLLRVGALPQWHGNGTSQHSAQTVMTGYRVARSRSLDQVKVLETRRAVLLPTGSSLVVRRYPLVRRSASGSVAAVRDSERTAAPKLLIRISRCVRFHPLSAVD